MGKRRCECRVLVGKPQVKRSLGRREHRWEENIEMLLQGSERMEQQANTLSERGKL
jgi:hypothetical protein